MQKQRGVHDQSLLHTQKTGTVVQHQTLALLECQGHSLTREELQKDRHWKYKQGIDLNIHVYK